MSYSCTVIIDKVIDLRSFPNQFTSFVQITLFVLAYKWVRSKIFQCGFISRFHTTEKTSIQWFLWVSNERYSQIEIVSSLEGWSCPRMTLNVQFRIFILLLTIAWMIIMLLVFLIFFIIYKNVSNNLAAILFFSKVDVGMTLSAWSCESITEQIW